MVPSGQRRWSNRRVQWIAGSFFAFTGIAFAATAANPGKGGVGLEIFSAVAAAACAVLLIRIIVGYSITATAGGVKVRELLRTRSLRWAEIVSFDVDTALVGMVQYRRKVLGATLKGGARIRWLALNDSPAPGDGWVDEAAEILNHYVRDYQGSRPHRGAP